MKGVKLCFRVVLFIKLYRGFYTRVTSEPVNEILKCDHSNESC